MKDLDYAVFLFCAGCALFLLGMETERIAARETAAWLPKPVSSLPRPDPWFINNCPEVCGICRARARMERVK